MTYLLASEEAELMVKCQCRRCRSTTSYWDANLAVVVRRAKSARWAIENPLEAAALRIERGPGS